MRIIHAPQIYHPGSTYLAHALYTTIDQDVNIEMTTSKHLESAKVVIMAPVPQRPKTLLQRLSSGLVHALPSLRTSIPRSDSITRPTTAPSAAWKSLRRRAVVTESEQPFTAQLEVATADNPEQLCPYEPNSYHSFARLGKRRCSFCGMRGPKIVLNEPCQACRDGGAGSHISSGDQLANTHRSRSTIDARHLASLADSVSSVDLAPRPVTPERAAKRIGNPPRVSKLPPGIIRLPAVNSLQVNPNRYSAARPLSRLATRSPDGRTSTVHPESPNSSSTAELSKKPASPRLHHIHGLPGSENFPFVHRHEIPKHAIALRAGSASPLTDRSNSPRSPSSVRRQHDYSETVYYDGKTSPFSASQAATAKSHVTTVLVQQAHLGGNAVTIGRQSSTLDAALGNSGVHRRHSPRQTRPANSPQVLVDATNSETTIGSQDSGSTRIGGTRLELKGGSPTGDNPSSEWTPRLRGGSGNERSSTNTFSFKLKRWLLTCHGPCPDDFDTDSDADLPPARVVSPQRVAAMRRKMNGRAPLPPHISRRVSTVPPAMDERPGPEGLSPSTTFTTTISGPTKRLSSFNFPALFHQRPESPISQPAPTVSHHALTHPFPHLRGGAASPDNLPPTLFWLAGWKSKSLSSNGWRQFRPKQRMGGLFGMAVFGRNYGTEYGNNVSQENGVASSFSASIDVAVEEAASVKSMRGGSSTSSPSSGSSLNSNSSSPMAAEPVKEPGTSAVDSTPTGTARSAQRVFTPASPALADDVSLCSGALPVKPGPTSPFDAAPPRAIGITEV